MPEKPVIFVVNDQPTISRLIEVLYGEKFTIVKAFSLREAKDVFSSLDPAKIAVVVMDGSVDDSVRVDTVPLVNFIRKTYAGTMLAASNSGDKNAVLMQAGCTCQTDGFDVVGPMKLILGK